MKELFVVISSHHNTTPKDSTDYSLITGYKSEEGILKCTYKEDTVIQIKLESVVFFDGFMEESGIDDVEEPKYLICHSGNFWFSNDKDREMIEELS